MVRVILDEIGQAERVLAQLRQAHDVGVGDIVRRGGAAVSAGPEGTARGAAADAPGCQRRRGEAVPRPLMDAAGTGCDSGYWPAEPG